MQLKFYLKKLCRRVCVRVGATSVDIFEVVVHPHAHLLSRLHIFNDAFNVVRTRPVARCVVHKGDAALLRNCQHISAFSRVFYRYFGPIYPLFPGSSVVKASCCRIVVPLALLSPCLLHSPLNYNILLRLYYTALI